MGIPPPVAVLILLPWLGRAGMGAAPPLGFNGAKYVSGAAREEVNDYTDIPSSIPKDCNDPAGGLPADWNAGGCAAGASAGRWEFTGAGQKTNLQQTSPCDSQSYACANRLPAWSGPHRVFAPQGTASGSLVVFLPGTGVPPSVYTGVLRAASMAGHRVLGLTYQSNPFATAQFNLWCEPNPPGYVSTPSECNNELHQQVLFGSSQVDAQYEGKSGDVWPVSRNHSVEALVGAVLQEQDWGAGFLLNDGIVDWSKIIISGHSQGAAHAAYLSQYRHVRAVLFSGPQDSWVGAKEWASWPAPSTLKRRSFYHAYEECAAEAGGGVLGLAGIGSYCQADSLPKLMALMGFGPISEWDGATVPTDLRHVISRAEPTAECTSGRKFHSATAGDSCAPEGSAVIWQALFSNMEPALEDARLSSKRVALVPPHRTTGAHTFMASEDEDYTDIASDLPKDCDDSKGGLPADWDAGGCAAGARARRWEFQASGQKTNDSLSDPCGGQSYACANRLRAWSGPHRMFAPKGEASGSLVVFLPGTGGSPAGYTGVCRAASKAGHRVLGLTYQSQPFATSQFNRWCDPSPPGYVSLARECNHELHQQVLFGASQVDKRYQGRSGNVWPVHRNHSVEALVLGVLQEQDWGASFLLDDGSVDWSKIIISGHSQGAAHAAYLSHYRHVRAVLFSGPQDSWDGAKEWAASPVPETLVRRSFYSAYEECAAEPGGGEMGAVGVGTYCQAGLLPKLTMLMGLSPITEWDGTAVPEGLKHVISRAQPTAECTSGRKYHTATAADSCAPEGSALIWEALFSGEGLSKAPSPDNTPELILAAVLVVGALLCVVVWFVCFRGIKEVAEEAAEMQ